MDDHTVVIFDANVLLNLYRYPSAASDDLLQLMNGLGDKAWLPYHAALEFHRNRLDVIAEQNRRFKEVQTVIEKGISSLTGEIEKLQLQKRHSTIDTTQFLAAIEVAEEEFFQTLEEQEGKQPDVTDQDALYEKLVGVFEGRVGDPPALQTWLDDVYSDGKHRYEMKMPPGYEDITKEGDTFSHRGLVYRAEYGDLILWKQILEKFSDGQCKRAFFITDDEKEDWWWIVRSHGAKRLGPRPELIEELHERTSIEQFFMYSSERFADRFSTLLNVQLQIATVSQVRDVRSTLQEEVSVACPSCGESAVVLIGMEAGSSALQRCGACFERFHIHRRGDNSVFTIAWGSKADREDEQRFRVLAICPSCNQRFTASFREHESQVERYCMNCRSALVISATGEVLSCEQSTPLAASCEEHTGNSYYLRCPDCVEARPVRSIWRDEQVTRAVCPLCKKLLEYQIQEDL